MVSIKKKIKSGYRGCAERSYISGGPPLWKRWSGCDDPAGRHLGRSGPTDPPQKEQCRKTVRTVLRTGPGVQRPEAPTTNQQLLSLSKGAYLLSIREASKQEVLSSRLLSSSLSNRPLSKVQGTSGWLV